MLSRIISPYVKYTTPDGLSGIRVRTWHPAWFVPVLKIQLRYWLGFYQRYKSYKKSLRNIAKVLCFYKKEEQSEQIVKILLLVDCGFECGHTEPYGFVPEAGCPIHDI